MARARYMWALLNVHLLKVHLENHKSSFRIESRKKCTKQARHVWELKERNNNTTLVYNGVY